MPLKNIILIGHSLGAHVCGFAAKTIKTLGVGTISRIFGADPAGPSFNDNECKDRLCETDAERVIALHTSKRLGMEKQAGHIDLYFNDGSSQPGCGKNKLFCLIVLGRMLSVPKMFSKMIDYKY